MCVAVVGYLVPEEWKLSSGACCRHAGPGYRLAMHCSVVACIRTIFAARARKRMLRKPSASSLRWSYIIPSLPPIEWSRPYVLHFHVATVCGSDRRFNLRLCRPFFTQT